MLTGSGCMRGDRENNKGSHSLLSIPLCAILCCLSEEWKRMERWLGITLEKDIQRRLWLSRSSKDSLLIECQHASSNSLSPPFSIALMHTQLWSICEYHLHASVAWLDADCHQHNPDFITIRLFCMNMYVNSMLYCSVSHLCLFEYVSVCLVSKAWSGTSRAVSLTLCPACTPSR